MSENTNPTATATEPRVQSAGSAPHGGPAKGTDAAARWNPASDSSAGPAFQKRAAATGRVQLDLRNGSCLCGCAQTATGRFRPGHDATLKGKLTRAALHGADLELEFGTGRATVKPRQLAAKLSSDKHDWAVALDRSVEKARKAAIEAAKRRQEAAAKKAAAAKEQGSSKLSLADFAA